INLHSCALNDEGLKYLAKRDLSKIKQLKLSGTGNKYTSEGVNHLKESKLDLTTLGLSESRIEIENIPWIFNMKHLTDLNLEKCKMTTTACQLLSEAGLNQLALLDLCDTGIDVNGAAHLSKMDFRNLTSLKLTRNRIGDEGIKHLSGCN